MRDSEELREASFLILAALAGGPQHGYAVIRDVQIASNGRVALVASTVYSAVGRLVASGLVAELSSDVVRGRYRRYYELTDLGVERLGDEIARWRSNTAHATLRLASRLSAGVG